MIAMLIGVVLAAHVIVEKIGGVELPERSAASAGASCTSRAA